MTRVVVTGLGVVSPVGSGRDRFWSNLCAGRPGIGPITHFDAASFPVRIGGEVRDLDPRSVTHRFPGAGEVKDRKVLLALAAADEAIRDSGLGACDLGGALLCVGVGLEMFQLDDLAPFVHGRAIRDWTGGLLQTPLDCTCNLLGERYGFSAGKVTNCSACAAGAQVLGEAWEVLREGRARIALAGAADSMLNPLGLGGFSLLRVLSDENDRPGQACRPFDASRKGTVLGEGAAFCVLETLDSAQDRGARIYAEVVGYGSSLDAFRVSDPDSTGEGAVRSMSMALASAGLQGQDIHCINAHGTGTPKNDVVETQAIKEVFGAHAYRVPVHAVKSMTGHMIAASGAVEAVASILTLARDQVPPTINLTEPDAACDLDYVADGPRAFGGRTVLSNSFGFGGQNATLIFQRYEHGL